MISRLSCIVEGHGEVESVPILVRRIVAEINPNHYLEVQPPIRVSRSKLVKDGELERTIEFAARKASSNGAILLLLDSDKDCAAELAPKLLARAKNARGNFPISVVLAEKEFEAWFIAAAASLRGFRGLQIDLESPTNPEDIRGAKEWIRARTQSGVYSPVVDQPKLTSKFSLELAKSTNSFGKLYREIEKLIKV